MTPAEDLYTAIRSQITTLAEAMALELEWLGRDNVTAIAAGPAPAWPSHFEEACRAHIDRAIAAIVAAGGGNTELLIRTMLHVYLLEITQAVVQWAKEKKP